ncbi:MAG: glycosyltransferase [bacterium]|nr:glycosyltransferase [bacterium]
MKSWSIKIGKALKVIQREGVINGGKRVFSLIFNFSRMMKKLPGGDVLFITNGVGDSALYRTQHVSEELNFNGLKSFVTVADSPYLLEYADSFKIFIFHRVLYTPKIEQFIGKIKERKKEIIFETDDLVFDSKYFKDLDYLKNINSLENKQYEKGIGEEILKDSYVKICATTTSYLAEKLEEYNKKVYIVPNKLSKRDVEVCDKIYLKKSSSHQVIRSSVKLGYFSGTLSHNKDFSVITDALMEIMEKHNNVELFLVGPLDIENKLNKFKNRIKQFPYVHREKHFENIASADINLSPLEMGNPFCESKSELKFFEAGIVCVPTVASATQTFREAISDGIDGFTAKDTKEWVEKLERLILDSKSRRSMGQKAREKTLQKYTTQNAKNEEYYSYLKSRL